MTPPERLRRRRCRVSLVMIARDEETNLPRALGSVAGLFDETIVAVDSRTTDRTRELAAELGARVVGFTWSDDFAAARNAALDHATGDYAFWLDADDVIDPPACAGLAKLFDRLRGSGPAAYQMPTPCGCQPLGDGRLLRTCLNLIRLFPLRDDVRWTYRVHEQILPALERAGIPVRDRPDLVIRHTGYDDSATVERKRVRNDRLIARELAERPGDPYPLYLAGRSAFAAGDFDRAIRLFEQGLSIEPRGEMEAAAARAMRFYLAQARAGTFEVAVSLP